MSMNPGLFNKRITLYKNVVTEDEIGQEIETPELFGKVWAMYRSARASEVIESGRQQLATEGRFVIRWSEHLQQFVDDERATFEISFKNRIYDVKSIINDNEANKTFTIIVEVRE